MVKPKKNHLSLESVGKHTCTLRPNT